MQFTAVAVYVNNLELALDFYTKKLGFDVGKTYGPKIINLVNNGTPFIVQEVPESETTSKNILIFETDDLNSTVKDLKAKDIKFIKDVPEDCPPGQYVAFKDPFENIFEVVEFKR